MILQTKNARKRVPIKNMKVGTFEAILKPVHQSAKIELFPHPPSPVTMIRDFLIFNA